MVAGTLPEIDLPVREEIPVIRTRLGEVLDMGQSFSAWATATDEYYGEMASRWTSLPEMLTVAEPLASTLYRALDGPNAMAEAAAMASRRLARACFYLYDDAHLLPGQISRATEELELLRQGIVSIAKQVAADPSQQDELRGTWLRYEVQAEEMRRNLARINREWEDAKASFRAVVGTLTERPPLSSPLTGQALATGLGHGDLVSGSQVQLTSFVDDPPDFLQQLVKGYAVYREEHVNPDDELEDHWSELSDDEICDEQRTALSTVAEMDADKLDEWLSKNPNMSASFMDHPLPPVEMRKWWEGLDEKTRELLSTHLPILVGNLAGIPFTDRDHALRSYVENDANWPPGDERRDLLRKRTRDQLNYDHHAPILLVALDPRDMQHSNSVGYCLGDPDHAEAATQVTFGMDSDVADTEQNPLAGEMSSAEGIYDEMQNRGGRRPQAVFINCYDSPSWNTEPNMDQAETVGQKLSSQAQTMRALAEHDGRPLIMTAVGHSYGSTGTVESVADSPPGTYDNIVTVGSAGITARGWDALEADPKLRLFWAEHPADNTADLGRNTAFRLGGHWHNPADVDGATEIDPGKRPTHIEHDGGLNAVGDEFIKDVEVTDDAHTANVSAGGSTEPGGFNPTGYGYLAPSSTPVKEIGALAWNEEF